MKLAVLFSATTFAICVSLCGAQSKPIEVDIPFDKNNWKGTAKHAKVLKFSAEWSKQEKQIAKRIKALKSDSRASRRKKFEALSSTSTTRFMDASEAIYALRFMREFWAEVSSLKVATRLNGCIFNAEGIPDPRYLKEMYTYWFAFHDSPTDCGDIGKKLLKFFPDDAELQHAFMIDCARGWAPLKARYEARKMLHSKWSRKLSAFEYNELAGQIDFSLIVLGKELKYVSSAKSFLQKAYDLAPNADKKRIMKMHLDYVNETYK